MLLLHAASSPTFPQRDRDTQKKNKQIQIKSDFAEGASVGRREHTERLCVWKVGAELEVAAQVVEQDRTGKRQMPIDL